MVGTTRRRGRPLLMVALTLALALVLAACGGDDDSSAGETTSGDTTTDTTTGDGTEEPTSEPPAELHPVVHGAAPCCYQLAVEQIIKDQEFDKKNGIDLELKVIDLSQLALVLSSGEVDIDFASVQLVANANLQGTALQCFAPLNNRFQIFGFVRADSPYQTITDLRGEKTANITEASAMYQYTNAILSLQGIDYASEFNVTTGPVPTVVELFERGDVEFLVVPDPPATQLLANDEYRLIYDAEEEMQELLDFEPEQNCIAARKDWIDENPERAAGVTQMWIDTLNYINDNPESIEAYAEPVGLTAPEEIEIAKERFGLYYGPAAWDDEVVANFNRNAAWLAENGLLPSLPDAEMFVNVLK